MSFNISGLLNLDPKASGADFTVSGGFVLKSPEERQI